MTTLPAETSTGGYTCAGCGQWVDYLVGHTCYKYAQYHPDPDNAGRAILYIPDNKQLIAVLERIAVALEKLATE